MAWYSENFDKVEQNVEEAKKRSNSGPNRLFIPKGESKIISILDERAFSFAEHGYEQNGKWNNWETCIGQENGCPFCLGRNFSYMVTVFTCIDHTPWERKDDRGNVETIVDQKKIFAVKENQALLLSKLKTQLGRLKGARLVISRGTKKNSAAWGENFTPDINGGQIVKTDWNQYEKDFLKPFPYEEIFKPKDRDALNAVYSYAKNSNYNTQARPVQAAPQQSSVATAAAASGGSNMPSSSYDADIPF